MVDKENPRWSGESLHSLAGESEIAAEIERMLYEPADSSEVLGELAFLELANH